MPKENYLDYTEVDVGADRIQRTGDPSNHIDHHAYNTEITYAYKGFGEDHFTNWEQLLKVKQVSASVDNAGGVPWALANAIGAMNSLDVANETFIYILMRLVSSVYRIELRECIAGAVTIEDSYVGSGNTDYWLTHDKATTTWTCKVYSDASRETLEGTLVGGLGSDYSFQYLYACSTLDNGADRNAVLEIDDLDLQEGGVTVTPPTLALALTTYIPTVTASANQIVTPSTLALVLTTYIPSILTPRLVIPSTLSLTLTAYAPTITVTADKVVTPPTLSLILTTYAPVVTAIGNVVVTPSTIALVLSVYAPTISVGGVTVVIPSTLALVLTTYAPEVTGTLIPPTLSLVLTTYAATIAVDRAVTPGLLALVLTTYIPNIATTKSIFMAIRLANRDIIMDMSKRG